MESPIRMTLIFLPATTRPKTNNVYWCIVKCKDLDLETIEYHYSFIEFKDGWKAPIMEGMELEVAAYCELENPEIYFKRKNRIIR